MTPERKKALLMILATFFVGMIAGALLLGLVGRMSDRSRKVSSGWRDGGREAFIDKILTVMEVDSSQAEEIRPLIVETMAEIDSVQAESDKSVKRILDSLEVKVQPLLTQDQLEKLKLFHRRGRVK